MKLYCDEMLKGLGKWLRAAGYDTSIARDQVDDGELIDLAITENRKLITRDRHLMKYRKAANVVVLLQCNLFEDCVKEITQKLDINWLHRPFTRCMLCNTVLSSATSEQLSRLNQSLQKTVNNVCYCGHCDQLFWEGSHVKRMRNKLNMFNHLKE